MFDEITPATAKGSSRLQVDISVHDTYSVTFNKNLAPRPEDGFLDFYGWFSLLFNSNQKHHVHYRTHPQTIHTPIIGTRISCAQKVGRHIHLGMDIIDSKDFQSSLYMLSWVCYGDQKSIRSHKNTKTYKNDQKC